VSITNQNIKHLKRIDLTSRTCTDAKRAMKRLLKYRKAKNLNVGFYFVLPPYEMKPKNFFQPEKITTRCPYCTSKLIQTEQGIVCSNEKIADIIHDIQQTKKRWGKKSDLFMSTRASRFWDQHEVMGRDTVCDYVQGNEEHKFRITNRLLVGNVDSKTIFSSKQR
jgi:hypothetical protein